MKLLGNRWVWRAMLGVAAAVLFAAGLTFYLLKKPPAVWTEAQRVLAELTPQDRADLAQGVLDRLSAIGNKSASQQNIELFPGKGEGATSAELSDQYIDEVVELRMSNEELISVVTDTFSEWAQQRGYEIPASITKPVVMAHSGKLVFAFELNTPSWKQVFSGNVDLRFEEDGMAHGRVEQLMAGSLPVSVMTIGDMLREKLPESEAGLANKAGEWLKELKDFEFRPVFKIEHRRRARILSVDITDTDVIATLRIQDHRTYKRHNGLMKDGKVAVTDTLSPATTWDGSAFADVPTTTD